MGVSNINIIPAIDKNGIINPDDPLMEMQNEFDLHNNMFWAGKGARDREFRKFYLSVIKVWQDNKELKIIIKKLKNTKLGKSNIEIEQIRMKIDVEQQKVMRLKKELDEAQAIVSKQIKTIKKHEESQLIDANRILELQEIYDKQEVELKDLKSTIYDQQKMIQELEKRNVTHFGSGKRQLDI